ncbi:hypothetical protein H4R33_005752 [Dimargaris cristalligena]|nr:hypothetical protein H4R33_005752 [Dimargaris cristalligena]
MRPPFRALIPAILGWCAVSFHLVCASIFIPLTNQTLKAYDFYGNTRQKYISVSSPLIPLPITGPSCTVSPVTSSGLNITSSSWTTSFDKVMLFVSGTQAERANCVSMPQILDQLITVQNWLSSAHYPPVYNIIFSTQAGENDSFGGPDRNNYDSYQSYLQTNVALTVVSSDAELPLAHQAELSLTTSNPDMVIVLQDNGPWNDLFESVLFTSLRWLTLGLHLFLAMFALGYAVITRFKQGAAMGVLPLGVWVTSFLWLVGLMAFPPGWPALTTQVAFASVTFTLFVVALYVTMLHWFTVVSSLLSPQHRLWPYRTAVRWVLILLGALAGLVYTAATFAYTISFSPNALVHGARLVSDRLFYMVVPAFVLGAPLITVGFAILYLPEKNYFESSKRNVYALAKNVAIFLALASFSGGVGLGAYLILLGYPSSLDKITQYAVACLIRSAFSVIFTVLWFLFLVNLTKLRTMGQKGGSRASDPTNSNRSRINSCSSTAPMNPAGTDVVYNDKLASPGWTSGDKSSFTAGASANSSLMLDPYQTPPSKRVGPTPPKKKKKGTRKGDSSQPFRISNPIVHINSGLDHYLNVPAAPPVPPIPFAITTTANNTGAPAPHQPQLVMSPALMPAEGMGLAPPPEFLNSYSIAGASVGGTASGIGLPEHDFPFPEGPRGNLDHFEDQDYATDHFPQENSFASSQVIAAPSSKGYSRYFRQHSFQDRMPSHEYIAQSDIIVHRRTASESLPSFYNAHFSFDQGGGGGSIIYQSPPRVSQNSDPSRVESDLNTSMTSTQLGYTYYNRQTDEQDEDNAFRSTSKPNKYKPNKSLPPLPRGEVMMTPNVI